MRLSGMTNLQKIALIKKRSGTEFLSTKFISKLDDKFAYDKISFIRPRVIFYCAGIDKRTKIASKLLRHCDQSYKSWQINGLSVIFPIYGNLLAFGFTAICLTQNDYRRAYF